MSEELPGLEEDSVRGRRQKRHLAGNWKADGEKERKGAMIRSFHGGSKTRQAEEEG